MQFKKQKNKSHKIFLKVHSALKIELLIIKKLRKAF